MSETRQRGTVLQAFSKRPGARGGQRWDDARDALALRACSALVGRRFDTALRELEEAQWLSPETLRVRAESRLAPLLRHAAENVPFYRETYRRLGLALDELRTLDDLRRLPIVSKALIREQTPDRFLAANLPAYRRLRSTTSGSTGEPFEFFLDRRAVPLVFASHFSLDAWHGLRPLDRHVRLMTPRVPSAPLEPAAPVGVRLGHEITSRLQACYEARTQERIPIWAVDGARIEAIYRRIESFRPAYLMGYTSVLATLADELTRQNLRLTRPLRGIIAIAETLSPLRRSLIEHYFAAPIINRYGLREFGYWIAQSCPASPHQFHAITELAIWETLREDGSPAAPGETGRVVLTHLHNYMMPFIRYETGDLAAAAEGSCACGRGFPLVGAIDGRSLESLRTPSGKLISPPVLGQYLFVKHAYVHTIRQYQLVQETPARVRLLIVPAAEFGAESRERLEADLTRLLGDEVRVAVECVRAIPCEPSGKRPIIKTCTNPSGAANERR